MRRTSMYNVARKKYVKFEYKVFVFLVLCGYVFPLDKWLIFRLKKPITEFLS